MICARAIAASHESRRTRCATSTRPQARVAEARRKRILHVARLRHLTLPAHTAGWPWRRKYRPKEPPTAIAEIKHVVI
eukprot:scaffold3879_cov114-Isochrysis_galbana.AAC.2